MEESRPSLEEVVTNFLSVYRNITHSTTGVSPARLLMDRDLRCRLDLIRPPLESAGLNKELRATVHKAQAKQKKSHDQTAQERIPFKVGDVVLVRHPNTRNWKRAKVISVLEDRYYAVQDGDTSVRRKMHMNHLIPGPRPRLTLTTTRERDKANRENNLSDTDSDFDTGANLEISKRGSVFS
jgi:hypothetical protein